MEIIPAVDLKDGRLVRLRQGRMDDETVFSSDPLGMAQKWQDLGAQRLHVVDLDGAVAGRPANAQAIAAICRGLNIPVQLGGGVRSLEGLKAAYDLGVDRVILGTMAAREPQLALEAAELYPGRIVIGIDARDGLVATQGWTETMTMNYLDLAAYFDLPAVAAIIFTDINRDGMHTGINLESTARLCQTTTRPIIAAGGLHDLEDVRKLKELEPLGLAGAITGRAIYEGTLDFGQALALAKEP